MPRKRGRPPQGREAKRYAIGARVSRKTRDWLEQCTAESGRSISQEIELRLEQSRQAEEAAGGPGILRFQLLTRACVDSIERQTGKRFDKDADTYAAARGAIDSILDLIGPNPQPNNTLTAQQKAGRMIVGLLFPELKQKD